MILRACPTPLVSIHHIHYIHPVQLTLDHCENLCLEVLRVLREAWENMRPPMQEQGVWPGCGQGTSTWVGLAYEVNSVVILVSSCPTAA